MSYHTEMPNGRPVLLQTLNPDFSGAEIAPLLEEATQTLDRVDSPVFYVMDTVAISVTFDDILQGANLAARGAQAPFHHPNVIETLVIAQNAALKMAALGVTTPMFGSARVKVFDSVEAAMTYCNQQMAG